MKKYLAIFGTLLLLFAFLGCKKESPTEGGVTVPAPSNLAVRVSGADSLSVMLEWTASAKNGTVDGYIIYFKDSVVESTANVYYQHIPSSLGEYAVKAYKGNKTSSAITVTTTLMPGENEGPVWWDADPDTGHPSGYGWDSQGSGQTYRVGGPGNYQNKDKIDFIFDWYPKTKGERLIDPNTLSPDFLHITGIAQNPGWNYATVDTAPSTGYYNMQEAVDGETYILWIQDKYYAKMKIDSIVTDGVHKYMKFRYGFQKIEGFRRLDTD